MSAVSGFLSTLNADPNDLVGEWQEGVLVRNAKGFNTGATLMALMSKLTVENADDAVYNWWERPPKTLNFYANAGYNSAVTTIGFVDVNTNALWPLLDTGAVLLSSVTNEMVQVTATPSNANITVTRGFAGTTAAAITQGDLWTYITFGKNESSTAANSTYETPSSYQNNIQIFERVITLSNAFKAGKVRTDLDGPLWERRAYMFEALINDIELAYFFGVKATIAGTNGNTFYTGGIQNALSAAGLSANILNGNGVAGVTLDAFKTWLQSFMVYGSDVKLAFCGPAPYAAISNYANSGANGFRIEGTEHVFGMNVTVIVTPFGELNLVMHPLFTNAIAYNNQMVVVDLKLIVQKSMNPIYLETNIQTPGATYYQEHFVAMLGIKQKFPAAFGYAYNLTTINAA